MSDEPVSEGTLRVRFPEIAWDQPVAIRLNQTLSWPRWGCRWCSVLRYTAPLFATREQALDHIEREHRLPESNPSKRREA